MNNYSVCCFTGHRIIEDSDLLQLKIRLDETIEALVKQGVFYYGSGGAIGFDQVAALTVLKKRELNPKIKLIMVLPCQNQDAYWKDSDKVIYKHLLEHADKIVYTSERYYKGCMEKRNLHLVTHSSFCVAYMKYKKSGTAQTVRFAHEKGLKVLNLAITE